MTPMPLGKGRELEPGVCVAGKLKLLKRIAEGGMGVVWLARNLTTQANVAIKVLLPDRQDDVHAAARFRHEAQLGAKLVHRNITRVFDLLEDDDGSLVLVMELLHGETLRSYCRAKGALSTREAVALIVPLLSALQYAHEHNVVHRDIKPSNIFLHVDSDGQMTPKLLDFGIAKADDSGVKTRTGDALGTPSYMSPEQVRALELDGRSDLFSVAVVLYEAITGQNPFAAATASAVLAHVLEVEVDPDPAIDPRVWIELQRTLSKQAYQRPRSARELATALCAALGESEVVLIQSLRRDPGELPAIEAFLDRDLETDATARDVQPAGESIVPGMPRRWPRATVPALAVAALLGVVGLLLGRASFRSDVVTTLPVATATALNAPVATSLVTAASAKVERSPPAPVSAEGSRSASAAAAAPPPRRPGRPSTPPPPPAPAPKLPAPATSSSLARTPGF